ncbi:hypothetical protein SEEE7927_18278 [Salmonella enterica subsp. enterica serovar Enteritidis str. 17927]|nr:hypothetical protein SEEE7927_18278 [Salmonella enterica subsp. enterica serovar Enteritidis str. 17927]
MLTMISVSQRTMSMMKCWVSMFHARSLKNALNLTMTRHHQKQASMAMNQTMTKPFVFQVVRKMYKQRLINT